MTISRLTTLTIIMMMKLIIIVVLLLQWTDRIIKAQKLGKTVSVASQEREIAKKGRNNQPFYLLIVHKNHLLDRLEFLRGNLESTIHLGH